MGKKRGENNGGCQFLGESCLRSPTPVTSDLTLLAKVCLVRCATNEIRQDTTLITDMRDLLCWASTPAANGPSIIGAIGMVPIELSEIWNVVFWAVKAQVHTWYEAHTQVNARARSCQARVYNCRGGKKEPRQLVKLECSWTEPCVCIGYGTVSYWQMERLSGCTLGPLSCGVAALIELTMLVKYFF